MERSMTKSLKYSPNRISTFLKENGLAIVEPELVNVAQRNYNGNIMLDFRYSDGSLIVEPADLESFEAYVISLYNEDPATFEERLHEDVEKASKAENQWKKEAEQRLDEERLAMAARIQEEIREEKRNPPKEYGVYFA
jgi:hypothetical protein